MTTTAIATTVSSTCESCGHGCSVLVVVPFPDGQRFEVCPTCAPPGTPPTTSSSLVVATVVRG